jgi:hypothetical protein
MNMAIIAVPPQNFSYICWMIDFAAVAGVA